MKKNLSFELSLGQPPMEQCVMDKLQVCFSFLNLGAGAESILQFADNSQKLLNHMEDKASNSFFLSTCRFFSIFLIHYNLSVGIKLYLIETM